FLECGGAQCGICTPGMLIAARALLDEKPNPTRDEIKEGIAGNLCRCTGYVKIFESVEKAAGARPAAESPRQAFARSSKSLYDVLASLAERRGSVKVIAGGTDLMVLMNAHQLEGEEFVDIWGLDELRGIDDEGDHLRIGALTSYTGLIRSA